MCWEVTYVMLNLNAGSQFDVMLEFVLNLKFNAATYCY